jgi:2-phosphosulfolactate phosphatase
VFSVEILRAALASCSSATGLAVVIDVLRAFTTAGYLFSAGVDEIILASGVQEAFQLRKELPDCLLLGEIDGIKVQGFDLGNSPSEIMERNLTGKRVIQRTTAGTQGVVLASHASPILTAALTNLSATVGYIKKLSPPKVTLIQTGLFPDQGWGDEDVACADAIDYMLSGRAVDRDEIAHRVRLSRSGSHYDGTRPDFPPKDLEMALDFDRFNFAMLVERTNGLPVLHSVEI